MTNLLRRNIFILMLGVTALALTAAGTTPSIAKDGRDSESSGSSDSSGSGHGGGDDNSGSSHGDDSSGHGGHNNDDDDNSGSDDDVDDSNDDSGDDSSKNQSASASKAGRAARPSAIITLTPENLAGVQNGSLAVVDNLDRVLEIELDQMNGAQVIKAKPHGGDAKRNPGPITSISVVPAAQAPIHG